MKKITLEQIKKNTEKILEDNFYITESRINQEKDKQKKDIITLEMRITGLDSVINYLYTELERLL